MRKSIYSYATCAFLMVFIIACSDNIETFDEVMKEYITIKERDPNYPWTPYSKEKYKYPEFTTKADNIEDYIGYGWKGTNFFDSYAKNITYPVIDAKKLISDGVVQYNNIPIYEGTSNKFSYSKFDNYTKKSNTVNKISSGTSFNLGLFSIGSKKTMTEIFGSNFTLNTQAVFGELNVQYESSFHKMQYSSVIAEIVKEKYLNKNFIRELYCTPAREFVENYGSFVLTNYIIGGRMTALYCGLYTETATETTMESTLESDINASYGFSLNASNGNVSGNLGIGKRYSNGVSSSGKISSMQLAVKTIGGSSQIPMFSLPTSFDNININLDTWLSSLSQEKSLTIIDFEQNGLIPITDFILEDNIKKHVTEYINNNNSRAGLLEPYIELTYLPYNLKELQLLSTLRTRFGDIILLGTYITTPTSADYVLELEKNRLSNIFGIKIKTNVKFPSSTTQDYQASIYFNPLESNKVMDLNNNTIFILNNTISAYNKKMAFTIRLDKIIDDYAMRTFINSIPTVQMTLDQIKKQYLIYAL